MMLHNGEMDIALQMAEEGENNAVKAHCYLLKAQKLMARRNKKQKILENIDKTNTDKVRTSLFIYLFILNGLECYRNVCYLHDSKCLFHFLMSFNMRIEH